MSEAVSALNGVAYAGFAHVTEQGLRGMVTVRGDLSDPAFAKAVRDVTGVDVPEVRTCVAAGDTAVAWMSPDELLISCPHDQADARVAALTEACGDQHALFVNVSDARAVFRVSGAGARDVMAKLAPVDFDAAAFQPGMFRRTRLAQIAAAFWMPDADTFEIICFRSVADYMMQILTLSAKPGGEVGYF